MGKKRLVETLPIGYEAASAVRGNAQYARLWANVASGPPDRGAQGLCLPDQMGCATSFTPRALQTRFTVSKRGCASARSAL